VKYSGAGTTITLSCSNHQNGYCSLSVKDEGSGIAEEDLPKIFDRFYRGDKARKTESGGHGLGLSIARIIVVAHNGKIKVRSKPGYGTVFTVLLPADR
jgi:signal transduction histidine kinase